jgi:hypothetical protein
MTTYFMTHDVRFADTVNRPMEVVRDIYRFLKTPLTAGVEEGMQRWLARNGREKRAPHDYTAARYGLSDEQLRQDYAEYRARYL